MKLGIKIKLAIILSVILTVTALLIGGIMVNQQRSSLETQMRTLGGTITDEFASDSKIPLLEKDHLAMNLLVQNILKYPGILDAFILNENLSIEGHAELKEVGTEYYGDRERLVKADEAAPWLIKEDPKALTFAAPIVFRDTRVGYTVISFSREFIREKVHDAITTVIIITFLVIVAGWIVSIPIAAGLLRPVFRLLKGTREIAIGHFGYRIPPIKSNDEVGNLVDSFNQMASELQKKEIVTGALNRYVSKEVADEILARPEDIRLGGDNRRVTVIFTDIRKFTSLSIQMPPKEIVELLNRYFTMVTAVIFRFGGTVDKFIGDAVMSVFGSPIARDDHLEQGVKAAVAMIALLKKVNMVRSDKGFVRLLMGVGLDSGVVIVGNMGSKTRMEYTAIGDTVNMASRLADLAGGGKILLSEEVYNRIADNVVANKLEGRQVKGIDRQLILYHIIDLKGAWKNEVDEVVESVFMEMAKKGIVC
ncbi:MAG: adenylate/guanylate cyclase domain-containing protein [Thermodesulfobacteriota bacterium]